MELINEGYTSIGYKEDNYILLVGKNPNSIVKYESLTKIYSFLSKRINSLKIPKVIELIKPNSKYEYGALKLEWVYDKVLNHNNINNINKDKFINSIINLFQELYNINIYEYNDKFNKETYKSSILKTIDININILIEYLNNDEKLKLANWLNKYKEYLNNFDDFHLIHGDMWYENFIFNSDFSNLNGIIDWENMNIFDSAYDLACLYCMGNDIVDALINSLSFLGDDLKYRVKINKELKNILSLEYIKNFENKDMLNNQINKIKESTIFN